MVEDMKMLNKVYALVEKGRVNEAIAFCEDLLGKEDNTDFHEIVGKNLLDLQDKLKKWLNDFYSLVSKEFGNTSFLKRISGKATYGEVGAIYCEMNGFTINHDEWYIDAFAYKKRGGSDLEWLAHWDNKKEIKPFTITGFGNLQKAFEDYMNNEKYNDQKLKKSAELCEYLIILRVQELFQKVYQEFKKENSTLVKVPLLVTAHDYEILLDMK